MGRNHASNSGPAPETDQPPADQPPADQPPADQPPADQPPADTGPEAPEEKVEEKSPRDLLELMRKPVFLAWLNSHADAAEKVLKSGPDGSGWQYNESKRADAEDFASAISGLRKAILAGEDDEQD